MSRPSPLATRPALAIACAIALTLAACNRGGGYGGDASAPSGDSAISQEANGDITLAADGTVHGEVTSGEYRRWLSAREALAGIRGARVPSAAQLRAFTAADVRRAVAALEQNAAAKAAIENAGLTVRDFILTGVALERQLALSSGSPLAAEETPPAAAPEPQSVPMSAPAADNMTPMPAMPPAEPPEPVEPAPPAARRPRRAPPPPPDVMDSAETRAPDTALVIPDHRDSTPAAPRPDSAVRRRVRPVPPPSPSPDSSQPPPPG